MEPQKENMPQWHRNQVASTLSKGRAGAGKDHQDGTEKIERSWKNLLIWRKCSQKFQTESRKEEIPDRIGAKVDARKPGISYVTAIKVIYLDHNYI